MLLKRFVHFRDSNLLGSLSAVVGKHKWCTFVRLKRLHSPLNYGFLLFSCSIQTNKLLDFVHRESRPTSQTPPSNRKRLYVPTKYSRLSRVVHNIINKYFIICLYDYHLFSLSLSARPAVVTRQSSVIGKLYSRVPSPDPVFVNRHHELG